MLVDQNLRKVSKNSQRKVNLTNKKKLLKVTRIYNAAIVKGLDLCLDFSKITSRNQLDGAGLLWWSIEMNRKLQYSDTHKTLASV